MKTRENFFKITVVCMLIVVFGVMSISSKVNAADKVTLTWWHLWGGTRTPLIEKVEADYKAMHPEVEFEITFTAPTEMMKKIVQAAGTGTLPDVFTIHTAWYTSLVPEETLLNLDDYLKNDQIVLKDILLEAEAERSSYNGSVYSLPNVTAGGQGLFFYNQGLMKQAGLDPIKDTPKNWEEFTKVSKIIVEKLNPGDQLDVIAWDPNQLTGQPMAAVFSYGAGHPIISDDGKTSLINTPGVIETMQKFDQYIQEVYGKFGGYKALLEWSSRVAGVDTGGAQVQPFIKEAQVFYVSGSWTIAQTKAGNPDLEFGILPVPGFNGQHGAIVKDGWSYAINKSSKQKDAAWDFLKYITIDPAGNGEFCKTQNRPSPIAAVNDDPHYQQIGQLWIDLIASMNLDIITSSPIYQNVITPWFQDVTARRVAGEPVEEIMEDIHDMFQSYLDDIH